MLIMPRLALLATILLAVAASPALAHEKKKAFSFGEPGKAENVTRTVEVETTDMYHFQMDLDEIQLGETIRFVVTNVAREPHEFSIGDTASQRAHYNLMKKNPHMSHEGDPDAVTLAPGETKELIWHFNKPVQGDIVFACQMKGHYDAGMHRKAKLRKATS